MKVKEELLRKILNIYILAGPFVDMLTSLAVRLGWGSVTMGVLVRFAFVGALILYVLFFYRGTHQWALRLAVLITSLYGLIYLGSTVSINGMGEICLQRSSKSYGTGWRIVLSNCRYYCKGDERLGSRKRGNSLFTLVPAINRNYSRKTRFLCYSS